ncbi:DUF2313 domain-containing protein [Janthinobacterium sp. HSC-3S05]|uniref:YmfQ family protein n=1 Tax=Janthinobacterium lividum TaxID=29581 RepID=UPI001CD82497|nr:putative phage tail protein [Janthinobacterium lividum]MCA1860920.1 DUF2313 domain-containing protein [Janthinobacterium lividum]
MAPAYTAADYLSALQSLLPRGPAWPRAPDAVQTSALAGLTPIYARQNLRANHLLVDGFPTTTVELLPEWEAALGLPDPCAGPAPTLQGRRAQVVARFTATGGQSINYMKSFALSLGYVIDITQFIPARAGILRAGLPLCGNAFAHAWRVSAPLHSSFAFRAGLSMAGEPLTSIGNAVLECELRKVAPAHTVVFFTYI